MAAKLPVYKKYYNLLPSAYKIGMTMIMAATGGYVFGHITIDEAAVIFAAAMVVIFGKDPSTNKIPIPPLNE